MLDILRPLLERSDRWWEPVATAFLARPMELALKHMDGRKFFDVSEFAWVREFEGHWRDIRAELDVLMADVTNVPNFHDVSPHQENITRDDRWKTHIFHVHGNRCDENCARCPRTAELLETIPGMKSAMFSILGARKHIARHRGAYGGVLRYHLGLIVPDEPQRCRIQVGNTIRHWEAGESLIFDDSYDHEVWNDTDEMRVVLFVDFVRPMPYPLSVWNELAVESLRWASMARLTAQNARKQARRR